ncbi:isochorismatase [Shewanella sp. Scap07]|uniref:YybH family protein n=1 Tax=Shewanella sp. Scap07 TaxID=2589987 RepID=UPI0015BE6A82|nr:nuclear transport factor 2 family protein [Shewanella sp. Scap07]QLE86567.1 isochorismatase [Shewanella sp. Scap07]
MSPEQVLAACQQGIAAWQQAFNNQDAAGCAAQYHDDCIMEAKPFGRFEGRAAIEVFWQGIIEQGFCDVDYTDVSWRAHPDEGYILTSKWTMNKAYGVVHREHWTLDKNGRARLISDEFEVLGER